MARIYTTNYTTEYTTGGSGCRTTAIDTGDYYTYSERFGTGDLSLCPSAWEPAIQISGGLDLNGMDVEKSIRELNKFKNEKEKEDMRYLYEVILVNPKNDAYEVFEATGKNGTSALFEAYSLSQTMEESEIKGVEFDDLKTQCRVLMEWKKAVE